jgi:hypothetical protein
MLLLCMFFFPIKITSLSNSKQKRHSGTWMPGERTKYSFNNLLCRYSVPRCATSRLSSDMKAGKKCFLISLPNFIFCPQSLQDNVDWLSSSWLFIIMNSVLNTESLNSISKNHIWKFPFKFNIQKFTSYLHFYGNKINMRAEWLSVQSSWKTWLMSFS